MSWSALLALALAPCIGAPLVASPQEGEPEAAPDGGAPEASDDGDAAAPQGLSLDPRLDDGRSSSADYVITARVEDAPPSELDDGPQKQLTGTLQLTWTNRSGEEVSDLWFHLYLNAYANNRSLHLTESQGRLRGVDIDRGYGWQNVTSVKVGDADITSTLQFRVPRSEAIFDRTLISVDLPEPVASGDSVTVDIEWASRLPRVRRRTGTKGDFIFLSHWFPKLAVYERGRGWRAHPFHMNTEFYADYGTYDVTLDLPAEYAGKVAASGKCVGEPETADGRVRTRFLAPSEADREYEDPAAAEGSSLPPRVHGFAWTADPDYVVYEKRFVWSEWAARYDGAVSEAARAFGKSPSELAGRDVVVRVMVHPERAGQAERHWRATAATLFFYGLWYGPYPYEELTAVDPAWGARAAGGMEYPTIFTCGSRMFTEPRMYTPESVTVHEAGHQFWYGLVGNNEPEAAWLDEGFNSFTDSETLFREYGTRRASTSYARYPVWGTAPTPRAGGGKIANAISLQRIDAPNPIRWALDRAGVEVPEDYDWLAPKKLSLRPLSVDGPLAYWRDLPEVAFVEEESDPRWGDRSSYLRDPDTDPIETLVWDYATRRSYSVNSYSRTAVSLRSLQALVGREAFMRGMREFSVRWRYRHPYPSDFYETFQEGADRQIQWYFDAVFRGTETVDWSCEVDQTREPESEGWFKCEDGSWSSECTPDAIEPAAGAGGDDVAGSEADPRIVEEGDDERPFTYSVLLRRDGGLDLPVDVRVTFDDGEVLDFEWTREQQMARNWWRLPIPPGQAKITSVIIDPERLWFLDTDMSDNQWFGESDGLAGWRWGERAMTRSSTLLQWLMAVGG